MTHADTAFRHGFLHGQGSVLMEQDRHAYLRRAPASNPPELMRETRCRVLKSFYVGGQPAEVGSVVTLPKHDAESMRALGRVEML